MGASNVKALVIAVVALAVIAYGASFVLGDRTVASSDRYQVGEAVRLDPNMRSDLPRDADAAENQE